MYCNIIYFCIYEHHSFSLNDYIHVFLVPGLPTPLFLLPVSIKAFFPFGLQYQSVAFKFK